MASRRTSTTPGRTAIDEVSNGGIFTYGDSVLGQINPLSLRANNYGNADYDIRHNFSADFSTRRSSIPATASSIR